MTCTFDNERVILGCLALFPELYADKMAKLSADLFADHVHCELFKAILCAYKISSNYDTALIASNLKDSDCRAELYHCAEVAQKTSPFDEHFRLLMSAAQERFIREQITESLIDGTPSTDKLREICDTADSAYNCDKEIDHRTDYDRYIKNLAKPCDTLYTRYRELDNILGGLRRGTLTVIGARPSVGKTTYALNIAQNMADYGRKVAFFTLEMTQEMIFEKLAARGCKIDSRALHGSIKPETQQIVADFFNHSKLRSNLSVIDDINTIEATDLSEITPQSSRR